MLSFVQAGSGDAGKPLSPPFSGLFCFCFVFSFRSQDSAGVLPVPLPIRCGSYSPGCNCQCGCSSRCAAGFPCLLFSVKLGDHSSFSADACYRSAAYSRDCAARCGRSRCGCSLPFRPLRCDFYSPCQDLPLWLLLPMVESAAALPGKTANLRESTRIASLFTRT